MTETKATKAAPADGRGNGIFTKEERAAIQEAAQDRKRSTRKTSPAEERAEGEAAIEAKIAEMPPHDAAIARRIHELVLSTAPDLMPRTYYGMPAYSRDGKNVCFFQPASKFKLRYSTFGFEQGARLDKGAMWPVAWALTDLTPEDEHRIVALVKEAAG